MPQALLLEVHDIYNNKLWRGHESHSNYSFIVKTFTALPTSLKISCCRLWISQSAQSKLENLGTIKGKICCDSTLS